MDPCIVIGNGPSLNDVPLEFLEKYDTFGSNRIYTHFTPTFYVSVNPLVIEQCLEDIKAVKSEEKFISSAFSVAVPGSTPLYSTNMPIFSRNPLERVYEGFTVTFVSLQLAFYYEYDPVLLVGVDHRYKYSGNPNEEQVFQGDDPNHFDPNYFKGMKWNLPDLARSEQAYKMAETVYSHEGRRIINLGPDSALNVFAKEDLKDWL